LKSLQLMIRLPVFMLVLILNPPLGLGSLSGPVEMVAEVVADETPVDLLVTEDGVLTDDVTGNLVVSEGATLTVLDATIHGNVWIESGGSLVGSGLLVKGSLRGCEAHSLVLDRSLNRSSRVEGRLGLRQMSGQLQLSDVQIRGPVLMEDSPAEQILFQDCEIGGDLLLFGNEVAERYEVRDCSIAGSLQWGWSRIPPLVEGNQVDRGIATGSEVEIRARGLAGGEWMKLQLVQQTVSRWKVDSDFGSYRYRSPETVTPDQVRVATVTYPPEIDDLSNGLEVDWLAIDGQIYQTDGTSVYAEGVAVEDRPARPGFHQTRTLTFDGFFQFGISRMEELLLQVQLNEVLPSGWSFELYNDSRDIRLKISDPRKRLAFLIRFGATGTIANMQASRIRREMLAPPFKREKTDRILQWTLWETGPLMVHPNPALPWYEDRFNITQAGTYDNVIHATVDVEMDANLGRLDVWSVNDRQWKREQEPYLDGSLASLTRTTVLEGGALLVRRVIRVGEVRLYGVPLAISNPLIEAWNPFSDKVFNSIALDLDARGNPSQWYAKPRGIPNYPHWPVQTTRGWAIAYHRSKRAKGPNIAVVFGQDPGGVVLADGSPASAWRYDLNTMDFRNGLAILPGFWPGELPEGSIVDQTLIFVPGYGIDASTREMLDRLAASLPAPRAYHPGAPLQGELSIIADRLGTLAEEEGLPTDQLGVVN
jgi:hypothetical protein